MSLSTNVADLATRVGTELKSHKTLINGNAADLSGLSTTAKSNLVAAVNEVAASVAGASGINDASTGTTSSWSSSKTASEIAAASTADRALANATGTLPTSQVANFTADVDARVQMVVGAAPAALDTLDEIAQALADDANFAATVNTALGNRVRADAAQSFTAPQQAQARTNIGAAAAADVGDASQDPVTAFEAALV